MQHRGDLNKVSIDGMLINIFSLPISLQVESYSKLMNFKEQIL